MRRWAKELVPVSHQEGLPLRGRASPGTFCSQWKESSSSSLRSLCQQRAIGTGNQEGTHRRNVYTMGGDTQGCGQERVPVTAFSTASCQDSFLPFSKCPLKHHGSTYLKYPSGLPPSPALVFVFSVAQTTTCDYLIHLLVSLCLPQDGKGRHQVWLVLALCPQHQQAQWVLGALGECLPARLQQLT